MQTILDLLEQLVASLLASSTLLQDDNILFQTCIIEFELVKILILERVFFSTFHASCTKTRHSNINCLFIYQNIIFPQLRDKVQPGIAKFEISDRHAVLYVDKIPSDHELCFNLELKRDFEVGIVQPVPVTVYDYYDPGQ